MALPSVVDAIESAVKEALLPRLPSSYAFIGVSTKNGGDLVGEYLEARVESRALQRTLLLQYFPASESHPYRVELVLQRYRHEKIPLRRLANLEAHAVQAKRATDTTPSSLELREEVQAFAVAAMESNEQSVRPILEGVKWPELPFDWQGHK
jgi:hypothetical protein